MLAGSCADQLNLDGSISPLLLPELNTNSHKLISIESK